MPNLKTVIIEGNGQAKMQARFHDGTNWGEWLDAELAHHKAGQAVQFKATYIVLEPAAGDSVKIENFNFATALDLHKSAIGNTIITKPIQGEQDISVAYLLICHNHAKNLKAYIDLSAAPEKVTETLGKGTAEEQIFDLNADFNSLIVRVDGVRTFDYKFANKQLFITAPIDSTITAEYNKLPQKTVSKILGTATGEEQVFDLVADSRSLKVFVAGEETENYKFANNQLTITAAANSEISVQWQEFLQENWLEMQKQYTRLDDNFSRGCFVSRFAYWCSGGNENPVAKLKIISDGDIFAFSAGFCY